MNNFPNFVTMKVICYILFGIAAFLFLPCVMVGQNVGEWQEPCDSSVAGKSLRQGGGISQLKKELQTAKNNGTINDSETNEQKMHVLGVSPDEYSQAATRGMDDYWSLGYRETYEEAYKEGLSQFSLGQIFSGVISLFSSLSGDNSGEMRHGGRSAGILEGNNDREKGNINRLNPVSCFKNNLPLIKLNNYKNDKAIFNYPGIGLPPR